MRSVVRTLRGLPLHIVHTFSASISSKCGGLFLIDWCCFYDLIRDSPIALLEAPFAFKRPDFGSFLRK